MWQCLICLCHIVISFAKSFVASIIVVNVTFSIKLMLFVIVDFDNSDDLFEFVWLGSPHSWCMGRKRPGKIVPVWACVCQDGNYVSIWELICWYCFFMRYVLLFALNHLVIKFQPHHDECWRIRKWECRRAGKVDQTKVSGGFRHNPKRKNVCPLHQWSWCRCW